MAWNVLQREAARLGAGVCGRLMRVLVLQHIACEPPGVFEDVLVERGHELVRVELDEGEPLPEGAWDAIVAMGGPMSVNDEDENPWLVGEKAADREPRARRAAVLGLVPRRAAAGRRARRARLRRACARGRRARGGADRGRARPIPCSARCRRASTRCSGTATRSTCPRAACCSRPRRPTRTRPSASGRSAYAVQFHIEVTRGDGRGVGRRARLRRVRRPRPRAGRQRPAAGGVPRGTPRMQQHARGMFERWCDLAEAAA